MTEKFYTVKEAAALLRISPKTLYKMTAARAVPFSRPGGTRSIRFSQEHIDQIAADGYQPVIAPPTRLRLVAKGVRRNATGPRPPAGPSTPPPPPGPATPSKGVAA